MIVWDGGGGRRGMETAINALQAETIKILGLMSLLMIVVIFQYRKT